LTWQHFQNKLSTVASYNNLSNSVTYFISVKFPVSAKYCCHFASAMSTSQDPTSISKPIENTVQKIFSDFLLNGCYCIILLKCFKSINLKFNLKKVNLSLLISLEHCWNISAKSQLIVEGFKFQKKFSTISVVKCDFKLVNQEVAEFLAEWVLP